MQVLRYQEFINESKNKSEIKEPLNFLREEYHRMKEKGISEDEINEGLLDTILDTLGGGYKDTIKDYIIDWAAEKIGIETRDEKGEPSFFYQLLRNVIEELEFSEVVNYFGKGSCKNWSKAIVKGLIETFEERGIDYLLSKLGVNMNMNQGLAGTLSAGIRETLTNGLNDTKFMNKVESMISSKICGFNFGDVIKGTDKQKIVSKIESEGEKNPDIFSKFSKMGLDSLIK